MARGKERIYREEKEFGKAIVNKESMAFQGLSPAYCEYILKKKEFVPRCRGVSILY